MKIFSPSQTGNYAFCPRYWKLKRDGWESKTIDYPELCAALGTGFSAVTEHHNRCRLNGVTINVEESLAFGLTALNIDLAKRIHKGARQISSLDEEFADKLPTLLKQAAYLHDKDDKLAPFKIVQVEQPLREEDRGRPDVVVSDGEVFPVDYKLKVKLDDKWKAKELSKYSRSWNMHHYCAGLQAKKYAIVLVVVGPKPYVHYEPYAVDPNYIQLWRQDAVQMWSEMSAITEFQADPSSHFTAPFVRGNTTHANEYGPCDFEDACLHYGLDPMRMSLEFVQIQRQREEPQVAS